MTPHQIVVVSLRLAAMVWLTYTLTHLWGLFAVFDAGSGVRLSGNLVLLSAAFQVFVCLVLWFFPSTIAANLLRCEQPSQEPAPARPLVEWQTLGVILIGIWALAQAIPDTVYLVTYYAMMSGSGLSVLDVDPEQKANALANLAQIGVGLWLMLGAKGFVAFLFRIRTAGVSKGTDSA